MQLFQFFLPNKDVNELVDLIVSNKMVCCIIIRKLKSNRNFLFDNYQNELSEKSFFDLITTYKNRLEKEIILFFTEYANENAISDRNFKLLFNKNLKKYNDDIIVILSHKNLKEDMLLYLCDLEKTFEVFFELAILYYKNPSFDHVIFEKFLKRFLSSKFSYMFDELFYELSLENTTKDKNQILLDIKLEWETNHRDGTGEDGTIRGGTIRGHQSGDGSMITNQGTVL